MADPEKKVDSRKLKVEERQNSRKKGHNTENTECRGTKSTQGTTIPGIRAGPKNKNAPTVVGAHFSTGNSLLEPYLVCQEENAKKRAEAGNDAVEYLGCFHLGYGRFLTVLCVRVCTGGTTLPMQTSYSNGRALQNQETRLMILD